MVTIESLHAVHIYEYNKYESAYHFEIEKSTVNAINN